MCPESPEEQVRILSGPFMIKPLIPEFIDEFFDYYTEHGAWGSLHIVLDDGNVEDSSVDFCIEWAKKDGDVIGYRLAKVLRIMTKSQRARLAQMDWESMQRKCKIHRKTGLTQRLKAERIIG